MLRLMKIRHINRFRHCKPKTLPRLHNHVAPSNRTTGISGAAKYLVVSIDDAAKEKNGEKIKKKKSLLLQLAADEIPPVMITIGTAHSPDRRHLLFQRCSEPNAPPDRFDATLKSTTLHSITNFSLNLNRLLNSFNFQGTD